ncbi:diguanylate cyclase (GGDEF) domain-containing protein [Ruminococcaceae bacterium FB2012]|nr:diguanylate cyclase (GGDEF) domain-containing protein [Ruminococcaceae bacterium FB2012]
MIKEYLLQDWSLILLLSAFAIALKITVFFDKTTIRRMYVLIVGVFLLSLVVFVEFNYTSQAGHVTLRRILMAIRYSATPFIISQIIFTLVKKQTLYIFIPSIILAVIDLISIFTGIVFLVDENNDFSRGPLGYLPFIVAGLYCIALVYLLIKRCNKKLMEIVPIAFLSFALLSDLVFPFVFGIDFSRIFCSTIAIALFVYYVFEILQQTKIDSLTGLLNRHAYHADIRKAPEEITALISIDMNGLKVINDTLGHAAGDEALVTLALCFRRALKSRQFGYRIGGDEFIILCRKSSQADMTELIRRIETNVGKTKYHCSIGHSFSADGKMPVDEMLKESDMMMYAMKERFYKERGEKRPDQVK